MVEEVLLRRESTLNTRKGALKEIAEVSSQQEAKKVTFKDVDEFYTDSESETDSKSSDQLQIVFKKDESDKLSQRDLMENIKLTRFSLVKLSDDQTSNRNPFSLEAP